MDKNTDTCCGEIKEENEIIMSFIVFWVSWKNREEK